MTNIIIGDIAEGQKWYGQVEFMKQQLVANHRSNNAFMSTWKQLSTDVKVFIKMVAGKPQAFIYAGKNEVFCIYPDMFSPVTTTPGIFVRDRILHLYGIGYNNLVDTELPTGYLTFVADTTPPYFTGRDMVSPYPYYRISLTHYEKMDARGYWINTKNTQAISFSGGFTQTYFWHEGALCILPGYATLACSMYRDDQVLVAHYIQGDFIDDVFLANRYTSDIQFTLFQLYYADGDVEAGIFHLAPIVSVLAYKSPMCMTHAYKGAFQRDGRTLVLHQNYGSMLGDQNIMLVMEIYFGKDADNYYYVSYPSYLYANDYFINHGGVTGLIPDKYGMYIEIFYQFDRRVLYYTKGNSLDEVYSLPERGAEQPAPFTEHRYLFADSVSGVIIYNAFYFTDEVVTMPTVQTHIEFGGVDYVVEDLPETPNPRADGYNPPVEPIYTNGLDFGDEFNKVSYCCDGTTLVLCYPNTTLVLDLKASGKNGVVYRKFNYRIDRLYYGTALHEFYELSLSVTRYTGQQ